MESLKFINEILVLYVDQEQEKLNLPNQKVLVIFYVFRGHLTKNVLKVLEDNNFIVTSVPANMTQLYQLIDLKVNGYVEKFSNNEVK